MFKKIIISFAAMLLFTLAFAKPTDWMYLVTSNQFGVITKTTTYQDLINLFGKEKLKDESRTGAEGRGSYKTTVINKGTLLEMIITWAENEWHKTIAIVECNNRKSPYYTKDKLKVGSTLVSVLQINKAAVNFYGFGWDYGGTIISYNKGCLQKAKFIFHLPGMAKTTLLYQAMVNSIAKCQKFQEEQPGFI